MTTAITNIIEQTIDILDQMEAHGAAEEAREELEAVEDNAALVANLVEELSEQVAGICQEQFSSDFDLGDEVANYLFEAEAFISKNRA